MVHAIFNRYLALFGLLLLKQFNLVVESALLLSMAELRSYKIRTVPRPTVGILLAPTISTQCYDALKAAMAFQWLRCLSLVPTLVALRASQWL
ncbi:hypothetical protein GJ744_007767 [Endocarpon pusillum]|uniref:Uncharacterized protein n=1 Tax=Endocarpon pusillum TaxID=364733 RepID=A0A8H7EBF0_9EURO|nr:hypothetical protein GJ744_007767 [Endocarpon pusillum]